MITDEPVPADNPALGIVQWIMAFCVTATRFPQSIHSSSSMLSIAETVISGLNASEARWRRCIDHSRSSVVGIW